MWWNFFELAHGKREWDGARVVVKKTLTIEQIQNPLCPLQNARQVLEESTQSMLSILIFNQKHLFFLEYFGTLE